MSKLIFFDTETTGLCPKEGHRMVEIGAIVMENWILQEDNKDSVFHHYINPERTIGPEVIKIHGITNEKVKYAPKFKDIASSFLKFIEGATLVAHNAKFDLKFINFQFGLLGIPEISNEIIDTLVVAKSKFPGSPASLDALCKRFDVSLKSRSFHGALLDSKLLACVYRKMVFDGQNSESLFFQNQSNDSKNDSLSSDFKDDSEISQKSFNINQYFFPIKKKIINPKNHEQEAHLKFLKKIFKSKS
jgi:DNA polymerase-3 subunit epsilon